MNIPDYDGWTSLMYAAKTGCADTVQSLLAFEAEVNIQEVQTTSEIERDLCYLLTAVPMTYSTVFLR